MELPTITLKRNVPRFADYIGYKGVLYKVIRPYGNYIILKKEPTL